MSYDWMRRKSWRTVAQETGLSSEAIEAIFQQAKEEAKGRKGKFSSDERAGFAIRTRLLMEYLLSLGVEEDCLPTARRDGFGYIRRPVTPLSGTGCAPQERFRPHWIRGNY